MIESGALAAGRNTGTGARMTMQVHYELIIEVKEEALEGRCDEGTDQARCRALPELRCALLCMRLWRW